MIYEYAIFEQLPDGTVVRHGCVQRLEGALRRMVELRTLNPNPSHEFFTLYSPASLPLGQTKVTMESSTQTRTRSNRTNTD